MRRLAVVVAGGMLVVAGARHSAPATEPPCGAGSSTFAYGPRWGPVVFPVTTANGLQNVVLSRNPSETPADLSIDVFGGATGSALRRIQRPSTSVANRHLVTTPSGDLAEFVLDTTQPCRVASTVRIDSGGSVVGGADLGFSLTGGTTPDGSTVVTSTDTADFDADGREDTVVELEGSSLEGRLVPQRTLTPPDYRDGTPGQATNGRVLVAGASGHVLVDVPKPFGRGPGPMAGFAPSPRGGVMLVAAMGSTDAGDGQWRTTVIALDRHGLVWRRDVTMLESPGAFMLVGGSPAFSSYTIPTIDLMGPVNPARITETAVVALDGSTGSQRWERRWSGDVLLYGSGGDLLVDDRAGAMAARLDGGSGETAWATPVAAPKTREQLPADLDGDGTVDLIFQDTPSGSTVVDGATGVATGRPTFGSKFVVVPDIDGDGGADVLSLGEPPVAVQATPNLGLQPVVAVNGHSGQVLWHQLVDTAPGAVLYATSARLRSRTSADVVLYHAHSSLRALDGRSGELLWRRPIS